MKFLQFSSFLTLHQESCEVEESVRGKVSFLTESYETILGEGLARHFLHQDGSNKVHTDIRSTLVRKGAVYRSFSLPRFKKFIWENKGSLEYFF